MFGRRSFLELMIGAGASRDPLLTEAALKAPALRPGHFLPGFERKTVRTSGAKINALVGGKGPPVLLLHGFTQTHIVWRKIAPELAKTHTVVLADLRGYGDSSKPEGGADHAGYSKRAMAKDQVEVMSALGFERFSLVGHDRGARVGHRLALDHPDRLERLVLINICPTAYMYKTTDRTFGERYFHWFFLIQDAPFPERLIGNNVDTWLHFAFDEQEPKSVEPEAFAEYRRCFADPKSIHAACEDHRASASIDLEHDSADQDRKVACPLLLLWGAKSMVGTYDVLRVWRDYAENVTGKAIDTGHWVPETAPAEVLAGVQRFLAA